MIRSERVYQIVFPGFAVSRPGRSARQGLLADAWALFADDRRAIRFKIVLLIVAAAAAAVLEAPWR